MKNLIDDLNTLMNCSSTSVLLSDGSSPVAIPGITHGEDVHELRAIEQQVQQYEMLHGNSFNEKIHREQARKSMLARQQELQSQGISWHSPQKAMYVHRYMRARQREFEQYLKMKELLNKEAVVLIKAKI